MDYLQHDGDSRSKYAGGFTKDGKNTPAYNADYYKKNREKILAQRRARMQAGARAKQAKGGEEKPAAREQYKRNNRTASQQQIAGAMNANAHRNDYLNKNENRPKRKTSVSGEKPKQNIRPRPGGNVDYSQFQKPGQNVNMNTPHPTNSHLAGRKRNDQGQHVTVGKRGEGLIASQNKDEAKKKPVVISKEARAARRQTDADRTGEGNWEKNQVQAFKNSRKTGTKPQNAATRGMPITTMSDDERSDVDKAKDFVNGLLQKAGKAAKDVGQKAKKAVDDAWKLREDIIKDPVGTYHKHKHHDVTSTAVEADVVTGKNNDGWIEKNGKRRKYRDRSELARDIAHDKVRLGSKQLMDEALYNDDYSKHPDHSNIGSAHNRLYLAKYTDQQTSRLDKAREEAKQWQDRANAMNTPVTRSAVPNGDTMRSSKKDAYAEVNTVSANGRETKRRYRDLSELSRDALNPNLANRTAEGGGIHATYKKTGKPVVFGSDAEFDRAYKNGEVYGFNNEGWEKLNKKYNDDYDRSTPSTRSAMSSGDATGGRRPQGRQRTDNGQHATVGKRGNGVDADRIAKAKAAASEAKIGVRHHKGPQLEAARKKAEAIAATIPGAKVVRVNAGTKNKKKSYYYRIDYPDSHSGPSGNINY